MNDDESGKMTILGLRLLLEGAVTWLEQHPGRPLCDVDTKLNAKEQRDQIAERSVLRSRIFRQGYWLSPFGDVSRLRSGIERRTRFCDGRGVPKQIAALIGFIQSGVLSLDPTSLPSCMNAVSEVFKPAIRECDSLLLGNMPREERNQG